METVRHIHMLFLHTQVATHANTRSSSYTPPPHTHTCTCGDGDGRGVPQPRAAGAEARGRGAGREDGHGLYYVIVWGVEFESGEIEGSGGMCIVEGWWAKERQRESLSEMLCVSLQITA